jgi:hypothetical protein
MSWRSGDKEGSVSGKEKLYEDPGTQLACTMAELVIVDHTPVTESNEHHIHAV